MKFLSGKFWKIFNNDDLKNKDFFFFKNAVLAYQYTHFRTLILIK